VSSRNNTAPGGYTGDCIMIVAAADLPMLPLVDLESFDRDLDRRFGISIR
jgi:hypothetical protein